MELDRGQVLGPGSFCGRGPLVCCRGLSLRTVERVGSRENLYRKREGCEGWYVLDTPETPSSYGSLCTPVKALTVWEGRKRIGMEVSSFWAMSGEESLDTSSVGRHDQSMLVST